VKLWFAHYDLVVSCANTSSLVQNYVWIELFGVLLQMSFQKLAFTKCLCQWLSTFSIKGVKSRLTALLEGRTEEILPQVNWHVLFCCRTKSVAQNIWGFIERPLRVAQRILGNRMRFSKQWLRTIGLCLMAQKCYSRLGLVIQKQALYFKLFSWFRFLFTFLLILRN